MPLGSWDTSTVSVGASTKKSDYDRLLYDITWLSSGTISVFGQKTFKSGTIFENNINASGTVFCSKLDIITGADTVSSGFHLGEAVDEGGWLSSFNSGGLRITAGAEYVGSSLIARHTAASYLELNSGIINFYTNTGLTDGVGFSATPRMSLLAGAYELRLYGTTFAINQSTSDASDNARITLSGGGTFSSARGAGIAMYGNEFSSSEGDLIFVAGNSGVANHGKISFYLSGAETHVMDKDGNIIFGAGKISTGVETAPDCDDGGLTLNQGANDGYILTLKSSDVGHGGAFSLETDTYSAFSKIQGAGGGLLLRSVTDGGETVGVSFSIQSALRDTADTTTSAAGRGVIELWGYQHDGAGNLSAVADAGNLLGIANNGSTKLLLKGNGDLWLAGGVTMQGDFVAAGGIDDDGSGISLKRRTVSIGVWNMDSTGTRDVVHGLGADWTAVVSMDCVIINDAGTAILKLNDPIGGAGTGSTLSGVRYIDSTNVRLTRATGSGFDSTNYDDTGMNRGYILITYKG